MSQKAKSLLSIVFTLLVALVSAHSAAHSHHFDFGKDGLTDCAHEDQAHSEQTCLFCLHRSFASSATVDRPVKLLTAITNYLTVLQPKSDYVLFDKLSIINSAPTRAPPQYL